MSARETVNTKKKDPALIVSENIECLAIAIAMALILKFFIIEAYKIPSGSMQPTIVGNDATGIFDRVLVSKFVYLLDEPERWDVVVFKYPLNTSQNYIKRLIGLPGEKITIKNGDIYVGGAIARKPEKTNSSVLKKIYPLGRKGETFDRFFSVAVGEARIDEDCVTLPDGGRATKAGIRDLYLDGYDPDWGIPVPPGLPSGNNAVGDVRLAFEVALDSASGGVKCVLEENGRRHTFFVGGEGCSQASYLEMRNTDTSRPADPRVVWSSQDVALAAGEVHEVVFSNIDDRLSIRIDGDEVAMFEYETDAVESGDAANALTFGPEGCAATFRNVEVFRDIYYLNDDPGKGYSEYEVPPRHYFCMGDNTQNSHDGRRWEAAVLELKDGRVLEGEYNRSRPLPFAIRFPESQQPCSFVDTNGDTHLVRGADLARPPEIEDWRFVDETYMLGKAMAVFWPIYPNFRWKLIR